MQMRSLVSARSAYVITAAVVLAVGAVALGAGLRSDSEGGRERRVDRSTQELKSLMTRTAGEPTAADLASEGTTGKGLGDHYLSEVRGKDCNLIQGALRDDRKLCEEKRAPATDHDFKGLVKRSG